MKKVKFCPKCGSKEIEWWLPNDWSRWVCKQCGYRGALIVEDGKMSEKIRKKYLETRKKK